MAIKRKFSERVFDTFNVILMILLIIVTLYPFLHVAFASISSVGKLVAHQGLLFYPLGFNPGAYKLVFDNPMIVAGYKNTLFLVAVGTFLNLLMTSMGAYVLSRKGFMLRNVIMFMTVFTMFFSGGLIPFYLLVKNLGLVNTRWALIFPTIINTFNLVVMRTSFAAIPDSMEESARIDGANDFTILFRIILPLSLPILSVMTLFYGVHHWNAWFLSMIFLRMRELYPLQLILREILITNSTDNMLTNVMMGDKEPISETVKYATIMVATVPILFVYPFLQKYFVKGMMIGAIKG